MEESTQILVFKTNVGATEKDQILLKLLKLDDIQDVSLDTDDCDRVLRVVTRSAAPGIIISALLSEGFFCQELE